jgi:hypothetical protein
LCQAPGAKPNIGDRKLWVDSDQRSHRGKRRVELPLIYEEFTMDEPVVRPHPEPWNKGKLVGQKAPFKLKETWAIRVRLQLFRRARDLALFDLGIDSNLRACNLVRLKVRDICHGDRVAARAIVMQQKTSRPVQFEISGRLDQGGRFALGRLPLPKPPP